MPARSWVGATGSGPSWVPAGPRCPVPGDTVACGIPSAVSRMSPVGAGHLDPGVTRRCPMAAGMPVSTPCPDSALAQFFHQRRGTPTGPSRLVRALGPPVTAGRVRDTASRSRPRQPHAPGQRGVGGSQPPTQGCSQWGTPLHPLPQKQHPRSPRSGV